MEVAMEKVHIIDRHGESFCEETCASMYKLFHKYMNRNVLHTVPSAVISAVYHTWQYITVLRNHTKPSRQS